MTIARIIKNYDDLAITRERQVILDLIEAALTAIQPRHVLNKNISVVNDILTIQDKTFDLSHYERVFFIGFGKGSSGIAKIVEEKLGAKLTAGWDIDVVEEKFQKIAFTMGTHPLPSQPNLDFTRQVLEKIGQVTEKDLIIVVICGGGSVLFESPHRISLEKLIEVNKALLKSGATISEMNVIRKHLSAVKGGGLAAKLYPATIASLIFSDVPGNDITVIASAPTVKDPTSLQDTQAILAKYQLDTSLQLSPDDFAETPKDEKYFKNVHNIVILSNRTALDAMQKKAQELGYQATIYADDIQGDAKTTGEKLIAYAKPGMITLFGGETTVKVTGAGKGGRNQELILAVLPHLDEKTTIASFDSDGWDFYELCGGIGDKTTLEKAADLHLDRQQYLNNDDSYTFLTKVGGGILTGKLESNVSDLMIVLKL